MKEKTAQKIKEKSSILKTSYNFSVCPTCKGTGWILREETELPEMKEVYGEDNKLSNSYSYPCPTCKGGLIEKTETAKKNSNIPVSFYDSNFSSFNWNIYRDEKGEVIELNTRETLVIDLLKNYKKWKLKGYGLYIYSETKGSGKTFLASCICNELMELYGIKTRFVSATNLLDIAQSGDKNSPDEYKREPIKLLCNCELLVIDDIGQKKNGVEWMDSILFRIIDDRMTKKLVTIFTSNLKIRELPIDDRIISRIEKMVISMKLPDFNVRSRESYEDKLKFLRDMGLVEGGE